MRYIAAIWVLLIIGCGLFNPAKYNPNPRPVVVVEEPKDSIRVDTIRLTNGVDHIIMLDTVKIK